MNLHFRFAGVAFTFIFLSLTQLLFADNTDYEQRKTDYINQSLANFSSDAIVLQAYNGQPLDTAYLNELLTGISSNTTADFDIVKLVRILYLTNGEYDNEILPVLYSLPFWINKSDTTRNYWSENHMIMWLSSDWLLHEKYGRPIDDNLQARLRHYLHLKIQYGFYEFFSSVYNPYTLSGLLNLADFAQDAEIKMLATQAAQHLLKNFLMLTNEQGVFMPSAGRNYYGKYETPYHQNHNNIIYLLTGLGEAPLRASHAGSFLASSSLFVDSVIASWTPTLDTLYHIGHTLDSGFVLNSQMSQLDKIVFQWSSGAYFHPDVVSETVQLLSDSNMWNHPDFALLRPFASIVTPENAVDLANSFSCISKSTVISGEDVTIFKHHSIVLSSLADFWKGKVGFQQYPCVANVGTTAVFTASGEPKSNWESRNSNNANVHLPYVAQHKNIALLMYRPEPTPSFLGTAFSHKEVALHWKDEDFDEVVNDSLWILGRQDENYVAVRRWCIGEIDSVQACPTNGGQSWVIMVGDSAMYGDFNHFQNIVHQSQFEEDWYIDSSSSQYVYYAKIVIDTVAIDYAWGVDTQLTSTVRNITNEALFNVFPNPATDDITIDVSAFANAFAEINVTDMLGRNVFKENSYISSAKKQINTREWASGGYLISIKSKQLQGVKRLIKK